LACRSVADERCSCISYDIAADQWFITTSSVAVQSSRQSTVEFHFISQLLDQVDVGLCMAGVDVRSLPARFPLHGDWRLMLFLTNNSHNITDELLPS